VKVAFAASEAIPYAKTGGLADVIGTLPQRLIEQGIDVASIRLPFTKKSIFSLLTTRRSMIAMVSMVHRTAIILTTVNGSPFFVKRCVRFVKKLILILSIAMIGRPG
jgi:hypothetical protein